MSQILKLFFNPYTMASLINAFFSFVILIYFSHNVSAAQYVQIGIFSALLGLMLPTIGFHSRNYFIFRAAKTAQITQEDANNLAAISILMLISIALLIAANLIFNFDQYFDFNLTNLLIICALAQWFYYAFLTISQSKKWDYTHFIIILTAATCGAAYILIKGHFSGLVWQDRAYAFIIAFSSSLPIFLALRKNHLPKFTTPQIKQSLNKAFKYSYPLIAYSLSISSVIFFDKYIINLYVGSTQAAQYISHSQFILVYFIIADSIYKKYTPLFLNNGSHKSLHEAFLIIITTAILTLILGKFLFNLIFPKHIIFDAYLFTLMLIAALLISTNKIISLIYNRTNSNQFLSMSAIIYNLASIVFMFIFTPKFGTNVPPIAIIIANSALALTLWLKATKLKGAK